MKILRVDLPTEVKVQSTHPGLFETASNPVLPIWDERGRVDAKELAKLLEFSKKEVAAAARVGKHDFSYNQRLPKAVEARLLEWASVLEMVARFFDGDVSKTTLWFKLPNPMLGGVPPRVMIRLGRTRMLASIIKDALSGMTA
jgi:hypothetical protein